MFTFTTSIKSRIIFSLLLMLFLAITTIFLSKEVKAGCSGQYTCQRVNNTCSCDDGSGSCTGNLTSCGTLGTCNCGCSCVSEQNSGGGFCGGNDQNACLNPSC